MRLFYDLRQNSYKKNANAHTRSQRKRIANLRDHTLHTLQSNQNECKFILASNSMCLLKKNPHKKLLTSAAAAVGAAITAAISTGWSPKDVGE